MAKMSQRIKEIFEKRRVVALSTASRDSMPNVIPVGAKKVIDDETILISDQFMDKTLKNMSENPYAAITFWSGSEGYQLKGTAFYETSGMRFEETAKWVKEMGKSLNKSLKSKGLVIFKITEIYNVSPGPDAGKRLG